MRLLYLLLVDPVLEFLTGLLGRSREPVEAIRQPLSKCRQTGLQGGSSSGSTTSGTTSAGNRRLARLAVRLAHRLLVGLAVSANDATTFKIFIIRVNHFLFCFDWCKEKKLSFYFLEKLEKGCGAVNRLSRR